MKYSVLILLFILLSSCNDKAIERERENLPGKWCITQAFYNPDNKDRLLNAEDRKGWRIEFTREGMFTLQEGDSIYKGNYSTNLFQVHFNCLDNQGKIKKQILWYNFSATKKRIDCTVMEKDGYYEYVWKKE